MNEGLVALVALLVLLMLVYLYATRIRGRQEKPETWRKRVTNAREMTLVAKERIALLRRAKRGKAKEKAWRAWLCDFAAAVEKFGVETRLLTTEEVFYVLYAINRLFHAEGVKRNGRLLHLKNYFARVIVRHRLHECTLRYIADDGKYRETFEVRYGGDSRLCTHLPVHKVFEDNILERSGRPLAKQVLWQYLPDRMKHTYRQYR